MTPRARLLLSALRQQLDRLAREGEPPSAHVGELRAVVDALDAELQKARAAAFMDGFIEGHDATVALIVEGGSLTPLAPTTGQPA